MKLQKALKLVEEVGENHENREALLSEARELVEEVRSSIAILIEEGERKIFWRNVAIASIVAMIAILSFLAYYYGPRVFWTLWLKIRTRCVIEIIERVRKVIDEEVKAVILAIIMIIDSERRVWQGRDD